MIIALYVLKNVKGILRVEFNEIDIVRHKLIQRIVEAYDKREKKQNPKEDDNKTQILELKK